MSQSNLKKALKRPLLKVQRSQKREAVFISDSKGVRLESEFDFEDSTLPSIKWFCRSGSRTCDAYDTLRDNIHELLASHNKLTVYIWTGTCDFTKKHRDSLIHLRFSKEEEVLNYFKDKFGDISGFCSRFSKIELVLLEIPPYSIQQWNVKVLGQTATKDQIDAFKEEDNKLKLQIKKVNEYINEFNERIRKRSPKFRFDVEKYTVNQRGYGYYHLNCSLLTDGIHAIPLLSRVWLMRIINMIYVDCF